MKGKTNLVVATAFAAALSLTSLQPVWSEPAPTVQNEVRVGEPGAPAGAPGAAPSPGAPASDPNGPPARRVLKRNPFVPPNAGAPTNVTTNTDPGNNTVEPTTTPTPTRNATPVRPATPPPEAPSFTLAGIFSSGGFPTALLMTPNGPVEARVGQTVQGYRVTAINLNSRQVIVEMRNHAFRVSLPKETPYGTSAPGSGGGNNSQGSSGGGNGPLPPPPAPKGGQ